MWKSDKVVENIIGTKPLFKEVFSKNKVTQNVKTYKNHKYYLDNDGLWKVEKDGVVFVVALDDSKTNGDRFINENANNEKTAKQYIDFMS